MQNRPYKILKLCVLGDLGVGKTSLSTRFVTDQFVSRYKPSYQACHFHKYLHTPDNSVYLQIWDTSGTERFRSVSPHLLRDAHGALLVYDITNMNTFTSLQQYWTQWILAHVPENFRLILVGNKLDKEALRQIDTRRAKKFATENAMLFYETSAKTGENVDLVFLDGANLLGDVLENSLEDTLELSRRQSKDLTCCSLM
ncbi:unnamed protein product [Lymnaea stagnalis]|uniref:Uncharacterized protein n=1 Tax=Lymnaea stagnalis TaxID=6523 RepID=A0AAV2ID13_LYMST